MNAYIGGGYGAAAGMIGAYALYVRRRTRLLTRALPAEPDGSLAAGPSRSLLADPDVLLAEPAGSTPTQSPVGPADADA